MNPSSFHSGGRMSEVWAKISHRARTLRSLTVTGVSLTSTARPIFSGMPQAVHSPAGARSAVAAIGSDTPASDSAVSAVFPRNVTGANRAEAGPSLCGDMA